MNQDKGILIAKLSVKSRTQDILKTISFDVRPGEILAVIGPAASGKSTLLRCINRLIDLNKELAVTGSIYINGRSVYDAGTYVPELRRKIGIVFPVPVPLPMTIKENVIFGLTLNNDIKRNDVNARIEISLKQAYLWDEVKTRLNEPALNLSGGQQQRLCLARTLALKPEVLMLDEPCSGLDPISTAKIEEALRELKKDMAIILVTNNVKQAARVSDKTAFILMGELVEYSPTHEIFTNPKDKRTENYVTGRFG